MVVHLQGITAAGGARIGPEQGVSGDQKLHVNGQGKIVD
jgi:hypothetical protein